MRLLFIGLGSIGQRHLRNVIGELSARGVPYTADALRSTDSPLPDGIAPVIRETFRDFRQLSDHYDLAFITNPTSEHFAALQKIAPAARAVFIEKPVFSDPDADLSALCLSRDGIYYVACPLRRSPVIRRVKELLSVMRPTAVRAVCSSYLPDWRGGDYRLSYSADPEKGGGVRRDLIHEWDYLVSLFGFPETVKSCSAHHSSLDIQSEDTAIYIARYPGMLLSLHLDYTGRAARRELELFCEGDTVIADIAQNEIRYLRRGETERFSPVDIHRAETDYFLDLAGGAAENVNPVGHALRVLRLALQ